MLCWPSSVRLALVWPQAWYWHLSPNPISSVSSTWDFRDEQQLLHRMSKKKVPLALSPVFFLCPGYCDGKNKIRITFANWKGFSFFGIYLFCFDLYHQSASCIAKKASLFIIHVYCPIPFIGANWRDMPFTWRFCTPLSKNYAVKEFCKKNIPGFFAKAKSIFNKNANFFISNVITVQPWTFYSRLSTMSGFFPHSIKKGRICRSHWTCWLTTVWRGPY